jgi:hypothetical protein
MRRRSSYATCQHVYPIQIPHDASPTLAILDNQAKIEYFDLIEARPL